MRTNVGMVAALAIALLAPAASQAGNNTPGMANQTRIDVTANHGHATYPDPTIVDHLVGLIQRTPAGHSIHTNVFQTETGDPVLTALSDAKTRGVNVWVIYGVGGENPPTGAFDWANQNTPQTRMKKCPTGCHNTANPEGKAHSKYFLFDRTQRAPGAALERAVWIGSANLNRGSGSRASNFAVTFWADNDMYSGMLGVWTDAWNRDPLNGDYYRPHLGWQQPHSGVVYSAQAASVAHISPDDDGPDMWAEQLRRQTAGAGCFVRVMQAQITDQRLAAVREIERLARGGCTVRVMIGQQGDETTPANIERDAKAVLCGLPGATNTQLRQRPRVHDKGVSLYGSYEGVWGRHQVFAGSHNWTGNALRDNDEVLLRVADSENAYDAFYQHFYSVWNSEKASALRCP